MPQIIKIDREKCSGCGQCITCCHENAIGMKDGKALMLREDHCDGLGNCLAVCPSGAISFEQRSSQENAPEGCPGSNARLVKIQAPPQQPGVSSETPESQLKQWPVQIKLVPVNAAYFSGANLLVAADCSAYAFANFHSEFMREKITTIGCPKLDECDYTEKLTAIIKSNDIKSVTVTRMEVPCCTGIESAVKNALKDSGKMIPLQLAVISTNGKLLD